MSRTTILLTRDSPIEGGNAYLDVHENDISEPDTPFPVALAGVERRGGWPAEGFRSMLDIRYW